MPRGGETSNTTTYDHDRNIGPCILRHFDPQTVAYAVTKDIRLPNDLTRREWRIGRALARGEGYGKSEEGGKDFATIHRPYRSYRTYSNLFHSPS